MKELKNKITLGVVLSSGGLDSLVTTAIARDECEKIALMHVSYGQITMGREAQAFDAICAHFEVSESVNICIPHIADFGASSLTHEAADIPTGPPEEGVPSTYVPFRNANLLAAAVSWAEAINAGAVYIGAVEEDSSGYPDCRKSFIDAFQSAVDEGTRPETSIVIRSPIIDKSKTEIVKLGVELKAPFELSWSCYKNEGLMACGECESCLLRLRGFHGAGAEDPIEYETLSAEAKAFVEGS